MAHSLELRVPFLDNEVAAMALGLATPLKVRGLAKKRLLRQALAPLLPKEVLRGPQAGLLDPGRRLAARPAAGLRARNALGRDARRGRAGSTRPRSPALLDRHCAGREDLSRQLWGLIAFTLWFDRYAH